MKTAVLALLLLGLAALASAQNTTATNGTAPANSTACVRTAAFIEDNEYIIAPIMVPALRQVFGRSWNGTVFLPSNSAVNNLKATLLNGTGLEDFPTGYTWADVFETRGMTDVLLYHLLPNQVLDPSTVTASRTLGPYPTELASANGTFCADADGLLSVRVNVTGGNTTAAVLDAVTASPARVTNNQTTCEGTVMLVNRVLLPCTTSRTLTTVIASIRRAANATTNGTSAINGTNGTDGTATPGTRGLTPPSPSPAAPSSASIAAQSLVALLACTVALLSVFLGF